MMCLEHHNCLLVLDFNFSVFEINFIDPLQPLHSINHTKNTSTSSPICLMLHVKTINNSFYQWQKF